jgi:hypothetical protein
MTETRGEHARARAAGMTPGQAARWIAYLERKAARGETPIDLHEAVRQLKAARS